MKKNILIGILTASVLFAGCGTKNQREAEAKNQPSPVPTAEVTPVPVTNEGFEISKTEKATATPVYTPTPTPVPTVRIGGSSVPITEDTLVLTASEELEYLGDFISLREVDASQFETDAETAAKYVKKYPETSFRFVVSIDGQKVTEATETLDLRENFFTDTELEALLNVFPGLKKVDVRGCGLSNEQLGAVAENHPDTRLVWEVKLGNHVLRTDAVGFSTLNPSKYYNESSSEAYKKKVKETKRLYTEDIEVLKYCPDLVALDLGHNYIDDLSVLEYLPKLQILIIADNKITDISVLSKLENLVYVEFFMNSVKDISPLSGHDKLLDLNFCNNDVSDLSPLATMPQLERVWCAGNNFKRAAGKALQEQLPECVVDYTAKDDTADGWREHERYDWMRSYVKGEHNPE